MKKIIVLFTALIALSGCLKDRTLTDYKDIILPVLNNPEKNPDMLIENYEYLRANGQVLKLTPDILYEGDDELAFRWVINGKDITPENRSEDPKNLDWVVNLTGDAVGALYVTRVHAQNDVIFKFMIKLDRPFQRGFVIVADNNGIQYNLLQEIRGKRGMEYKSHPGIMTTGTPGENWVGCPEFWAPEAWNGMSKDKTGHMLHLTTDVQSSFSVDELSMSSRTPLQDEFFEGTLPEGVNSFRSVAYGGYVSYLLGDNNKLYERIGGDGFYTGKYMSALPVQYEGKDLVISDLLATPYKAGIILAREKETDTFYAITNAFPSGPNQKAGKVSKLPVSDKHPEDLNTFKGEDIVYSRLLLPSMIMYPYGETPFVLFMVTKNRETNEYSVSEYHIEMASNGVVAWTDAVYTRAALPGFGENSCVIPLEVKYDGMSPSPFYYTDSADPTRLMVAKRTSSGPTQIKEYHQFESPVVSMDVGACGSSSGTFGVVLENGTAHVLTVTTKTAYDYVAPNPTDEKVKPTIKYTWENIEGKILKIDFRYGDMGNYHPTY